MPLRCNCSFAEQVVKNKACGEFTTLHSGWSISHPCERIAFAIVQVEVRYPDRIVGIALLLCSMQ